jgi:hypothetical protein
MAYKDEYEVAQLYTDGAFLKQVETEFDGDDLRFEFHMAPFCCLATERFAAACLQGVRTDLSAFHMTFKGFVSQPRKKNAPPVRTM